MSALSTFVLIRLLEEINQRLTVSKTLEDSETDLTGDRIRSLITRNMKRVTFYLEVVIVMKRANRDGIIKKKQYLVTG